MAESQTHIGPTIVINGEFKSEEDVSVHGKLQGRVETTADLYVEEGGTVEAEVVTRNIDIRGKVVGNVSASDRFELHPEGSAHGDVRAPRMVVADGGHYKGRVEMGPVSAHTRAELAASNPAPAVARPVIRKR